MGQKQGVWTASLWLLIRILLLRVAGGRGAVTDDVAACFALPIFFFFFVCYSNDGPQFLPLVTADK